jgi:putative hydrolase of HD superfamily
MTYRYVSGDTTIDYAKAYELLIVHDLPEIIAGDIPIFDEPTIAIAHARERAGLTELVSNTDPDFATIISQHWEEFEALASAEAKLAKVSDRFQPMLQNLSSSGRGWQERSVTLEQIERITGIVREHSDFFATLLMAMLQAAERGKFLPRPSEKSTPL